MCDEPKDKEQTAVGPALAGELELSRDRHLNPGRTHTEHFLELGEIVLWGYKSQNPGKWGEVESNKVDSPSFWQKIKSPLVISA